MGKLYFLIMMVCLMVANNRLFSQKQPACRINGPKTFEVCSHSNFSYLITIGDTSLLYYILHCSISRPAVDGITNPRTNLDVNFPFFGFPAVPFSETLNNNTRQPIVVTYYFTVTTFACSDIKDSIKVTVNPAPIIDTLNTGKRAYCNGETVEEIRFSSKLFPSSVITWKSDLDIGFDTSSDASIHRFSAKNTSTTTAVTARITVSIANFFADISTGCVHGADSIFSITVNPSPAKPGFTSLFSNPDAAPLKLCSGSENINFNVNAPVQGFDYRWTSFSRSPTVAIRDTSHANTVISFYGTANDTIYLTAKNAPGCTSTTAQAVQVSLPSTATDKRKIFLSQPGNLLIYPNNSLAAYQWGYDAVIRSADTSYGAPVPVDGQVYQFFIPDTRFIDAPTNLLNETNYLYWVMLRNGGCTTRVYYNGPYANRVIGTPAADSTVALHIGPNPNNGAFKIALTGNIYGNIHAEMYNAVGRIVFSKNFVKITPAVSEQMNVTYLPAGLYFLVLYSSDLKKISTRFVIQH